jgi:hypothetical protein
VKEDASTCENAGLESGAFGLVCSVRSGRRFSDAGAQVIHCYPLRSDEFGRKSETSYPVAGVAQAKWTRVNATDIFHESLPPDDFLRAVIRIFQVKS